MDENNKIDTKLPKEVIDEVIKLVSNPKVKQEYHLDSIEEFIVKAIILFIEKVKSEIPDYQLSRILSALGY